MIHELNQTEKRIFHQTAVVLLKPDAINFGLDTNFLNDFEDLGLVTIYRQMVQFTPSDMLYMYPEWADDPKIFPALEKYMSSGQSMLLLLQGCSDEEDLHTFVKQKKGRANTPGLRNKYIRFFEEELKIMYPDETEFTYQLSQNRIHSPENSTEALNFLLYLWPRTDRIKFKDQCPELYDALNRRLKPSVI
jgi:nucleoside diphosphate kinase